MKLLNKLKHMTFLILICLSLFGCDSKETVNIARDSVVVAFGDSLTQGVGVSDSHSYPSQLESILGVKVINSGISGQTSQQGLARLNEVLNKHLPDVVIICYGGNDVLQRKSKSKLADNLSQMILAAKAKALVSGRTTPDIDDVKKMLNPILRHRIIPSFNAEADGITRDNILEKLLNDSN